MAQNWIMTPEESKSTERTPWIEPNVDSNYGYFEDYIISFIPQSW